MKTFLTSNRSRRKSRRPRISLSAAVIVLMSVSPAVFAIDPPHDSDTPFCGDCHAVHHSEGVTLTSVEGNANLCQSCHVPGGSASQHPFVNSDQALSWPGLPTGVSAQGTSHRWDSGPAGHVAFSGGTSTGTIQSSGTYTGAYAKTYTITIASAGNVGAALFNWTATSPGGGAGNNLLTGTNVALNEGVLATFVDGTNGSFQAGEQWRIFVRPDLRSPTNEALATRMVGGVMMCSTCHNEHSQAAQPFDSAALPYTTNLAGEFVGTNRHFLRIANDLHQMCNDCHAARNVAAAAAGSHPVGITFAPDTTHKLPTSLPVEAGSGKFGCLTCHRVHGSPDADGKTLRMANSVALCNDCHTLSDVSSAHFATANSATLWPGGKFGSLMPARTDLNDRGTCLNCHATHGWPTNSVNPQIHYEHLLADYQENLCYTCHGANGPATKLVYADFQKARHHPVLNGDALRRTGRSVECDECHNSHKTKIGTRNYSATATSTRNNVANAPSLAGADGVAFNYSGLTNFQTVLTNRFTPTPNTTGVTYEYQICFKCHTSYFWKTGTPPNGISPNGTAVNPVETDLAQEFSPMNKSGHPIMTGLNNYPNSTAFSGRKGLTAAQMKAPWNVNVGTQTMMCTDCHNTDAATPAAQGPHGSASQFMLRGPNAANWPAVTSFATSWCANCHNDTGLSMDGHANHHSAGGCYRCHVVISHGSAMFCLIADRDGSMPARYAYNNGKTTLRITSYTKTSGSYSSGNCRASCSDHTTASSTSMENW